MLENRARKISLSFHPKQGRKYYALAIRNFFMNKKSTYYFLGTSPHYTNLATLVRNTGETGDIYYFSTIIARSIFWGSGTLDRIRTTE